MSNGKLEWIPRPPNKRERVIAALLMAAIVVASVSSYAGWRLFGDYDKAVTMGVAILAAIVITRLMPSVGRR